jgi:hypothetical protein
MPESRFLARRSNFPQKALTPHDDKDARSLQHVGNANRRAAIFHFLARQGRRILRFIQVLIFKLQAARILR